MRHTPRSLRAATRGEPPLTAPGEKPAQPETQQSRKENRRGTSSLPLFPAENSCLGAGRTHKVHGPAAENSWVTRKRHQFKHRSWRLAAGGDPHTDFTHHAAWPWQYRAQNRALCLPTQTPPTSSGSRAHPPEGSTLTSQRRREGRRKLADTHPPGRSLQGTWRTGPRQSAG